MAAYTKYTVELLEPLVRESTSVAQVLRKLGKKQCGGVATNVSKVIKKFGIDTSHFLGQAANCGTEHKGGSKRLHWSKILIKRRDDQQREKAVRLRRALIESGRQYKCENKNCNIKGEWLNKQLTLQVNHKNGDWTDCTPENVEFLCPNCHSQI
jgi:hypothetical protein